METRAETKGYFLVLANGRKFLLVSLREGFGVRFRWVVGGGGCFPEKLREKGTGVSVGLGWGQAKEPQVSAHAFSKLPFSKLPLSSTVGPWINKFGDHFETGWVAGKICLCFWVVIPYGGEKHVNRIPRKFWDNPAKVLFMCFSLRSFLSLSLSPQAVGFRGVRPLVAIRNWPYRPQHPENSKTRKSDSKLTFGTSAKEIP